MTDCLHRKSNEILRHNRWKITISFCSRKILILIEASVICQRVVVVNTYYFLIIKMKPFQFLFLKPTLNFPFISLITSQQQHMTDNTMELASLIVIVILLQNKTLIHVKLKRLCNSTLVRLQKVAIVIATTTTTTIQHFLRLIHLDLKFPEKTIQLQRIFRSFNRLL